MHKSYTERNAAYLRQIELLDECHHAGVPFVAWDGDHKMEQVDFDAITNHPLGIVASPELMPRLGVYPLMYPNPYPMVSPRDRTPFMTGDDLVYIGNNYERWDQFVEYIAKPANWGLTVKCFGNWLEPHPDRESPLEVRKVAKKVFFPGRIPEAVVRDTYATFDFTIHLSKPSYCKSGFVTMRWAEAASSGTVAFLPGEFGVVPEEFENVVVKNGRALFEKIRGKKMMTEAEWKLHLISQQTWVQENMRVEPWIELFEEMAGRA